MATKEISNVLKLIPDKNVMIASWNRTMFDIASLCNLIDFNYQSHLQVVIGDTSLNLVDEKPADNYNTWIHLKTWALRFEGLDCDIDNLWLVNFEISFNDKDLTQSFEEFSICHMDCTKIAFGIGLESHSQL